MKKSTHKRLTAWLLTLALVVTLLPGMGMTALAVEDGGEGNGPPAVEVVESEDESSGSDETVGTPPSTEPESKEENKTTEGEGGSSGSDYNVGADTQPRSPMKVPVAPTGLNDYPEVMDVSVDGGKPFATPGMYYFKNGDLAGNFSGNADNYNAYYNRSTGVLTLRDYSGGSIGIASNGRNITIVLEGENSVNNGSINGIKGCNITITSSKGGTLSITSRTSGTAAIGIATGNAPGINTGDVIITGDAEVTIDSANSGTSGSVAAYGIYAEKNITISGDASVNITCATPSNTASYNCYGIFTRNKLTVNTNGEIVVNVKNAGNSNTCSIGIQSTSAPELTMVGSMIVEWTKDESDPTNSGAAIYKSYSFSAETHAVNIDKAHCYASYRFGTPRNVTVNNGTLTGPGVKYPNRIGKFLYDDKVDLTAPPRQVSDTDSTPILFDKWTSANVSIANSTSQNEAYIMVPYTDATVTAHYKAFTVQPSFTRISSTKGTVSFTLISTEYSRFPELCHVDNLEDGQTGFMRVDGTTTYESKVYKNYNPPGEYVVKVEYDNVTYYSEPFVIDYSARAASVSPVTISGETGKPIESADVTVTLQDCTFNNSLGSTGGWITNLPAGLNQSVTRVSDTEAKITVSGKPTVNCVEQIQVTVPKAALSDGSSPLTAPSHENAKFAIKTTLTTAAATIQHPVAGQNPDMNPVPADPSKYTVDFDEWSGPDGRMGPTDTFEADKWYDCYLIFTPKPGYAFASGSDMTYTINGETARERSPWVYLSMKALPSVISLDVSGTVTLKNVIAGSNEQPAKTITVTNHLSSLISNIPITLSNTKDFRVIPGSSAIVSIPANGTGTFAIWPAPKLQAGYYTTTVTVGGGSSGIIEQSFTVEVNACNVIKLTANPLTYNGEWQTGVIANVADVTIDGNSQCDAGDYTATAHLKSGYYMWPDYTTDSTKDISWSIGKRDPKIEDFDVTLPDERTEYEIQFGTDGPYATYDGTAKTATAKLKAKYSGCGEITVKYRKFVSTGTYETLDAAVDAGMYDVLVYVAAGGSNFNAASALVYNTSFLIKPVPLSMPQLTVKAPTTQSGMGKIVGTTSQMRCAPKGTTSWQPCSNGETSVMPGTYYLYLKADSTDTNHTDSSYAEVTVPKYGAGVTVSGTVKSYGSASEAVTVTLLQGTSVIGSPQVLTGASGSVPYSQNYSFPAVPAGEYTLKVEKKGHVTREYAIAVASDPVMQDVKICLLGDVDGNGSVNMVDYIKVRQHAQSVSFLTDYALACADVNGDGNVNMVDYIKVRQHAQNIALLW